MSIFIYPKFTSEHLLRTILFYPIERFDEGLNTIFYFEYSNYDFQNITRKVSDGQTRSLKETLERTLSN